MTKLNNKGQVLVIFVFLIPILVLVFAFVADYGNVLYHQNRLNSINKTALIYAKNHKGDYDIEKVKELVRKNDNEAKINKCEDQDKKITLVLKKSIKSYFGNTIGINKYNITSKYTMDVEKGKFIEE